MTATPESTITPEYFYIDQGLYWVFKTYNEALLDDIFRFAGPIDFYCVECSRISTFKSNDFYTRPPPPSVGPPSRRVAVPDDQIVTRAFSCSRDGDHRAHFTLLASVRTHSIQKIGQFPSHADISSAEIERFRKDFSLDFRELNRAIGLAAHGMGAGAFVYLRRVFERHVSLAADSKAAADSSFDRANWVSLRMDDKISALSGELPNFLVENRNTIYKILSSGVHELSEDECKSYFPLLKQAIIIWLGDIQDAKVKQQQKPITASALQLALDGLKKSGRATSPGKP